MKDRAPTGLRHVARGQSEAATPGWHGREITKPWKGGSNQAVQRFLTSQPIGGEPLGAPVRDFFESRFGRDFGNVRVHTGPEADGAARSFGALAYTRGADVVFRGGQYAPHSAAGRRLLAHELTHVVQQGEARGTSPPAILPYRSASDPNFGKCDTSTLKEGTFSKSDKDTLPWIERIKVTFDGTTTDSDSDLVPSGKLVADYFANPAALSQISVSVVGGKASQGLTDAGNHTILRIEGCGYHHASVPKADRVKGHDRGFKYFVPAKKSQATMNFAIFFVQGEKTGNQAIHEGSLTTGSLACVHVGNASTIQQLNYHSVENRTKVEVSYGAAARTAVCCERKKTKGFMVSNPCKGEDPKKCP